MEPVRTTPEIVLAKKRQWLLAITTTGVLLAMFVAYVLASIFHTKIISPKSAKAQVLIE